MKPNRHNAVLAFAAVLFVVAVLAACNVNILKTAQGQGIAGSSGDPVTNATDPQCTVRAVDLGAEHDQRTVAPGGAVKLSVSLTGNQDVELLDSCRASKSPTFALESTPAPDQCVLEGGGFDTVVRARATAALGTVCKVRAHAGGKDSNEYSITVQS